MTLYDCSKCGSVHDSSDPPCSLVIFRAKIEAKPLAEHLVEVNRHNIQAGIALQREVAWLKTELRAVAERVRSACVRECEFAAMAPTKNDALLLSGRLRDLNLALLVGLPPEPEEIACSGGCGMRTTEKEAKDYPKPWRCIVCLMNGKGASP